MNNHLFAYLASNPTRTPEEDAALTSFIGPATTAEDCQALLKRMRTANRVAKHRGTLPQVVNAGDCGNSIPAPKREQSELIGCPPGVTTEEWWVIQLRLEGCTFEEIGERMHVNEKTARLKLKSASLKLYKTFLPANDPEM